MKVAIVFAVSVVIIVIFGKHAWKYLTEVCERKVQILAVNWGKIICNVKKYEEYFTQLCNRTVPENGCQKFLQICEIMQMAGNTANLVQLMDLEREWQKIHKNCMNVAMQKGNYEEANKKLDAIACDIMLDIIEIKNNL